MNSISGTIHDGQIILSGPISWPEGTNVRVHRIEPNSLEIDTSGTGNWGQANEDTGPTAIAEWILSVRSLPSLEMTEKEFTDWENARVEQKALDVERSRRYVDNVVEPTQ